MGKRDRKDERAGSSLGPFGPVILHVSDGGLDELQALFEYLRAHDWLAESESRLSDGEVLRLSSVASSPVASCEAKKKAMILLAHGCNPRASAELGRLVATVEPPLRGFAALALDESLQGSPGAVSSMLS